MRSLRLLAASFLLPAMAFAAAPANYYDSVNTSNGTTLRSTLHALIQNHTRVDYDNGNNWPVLESADQDPANSLNILDLYKNASVPKTDRGTGYNREHVWPQSRGFPDTSDNAGQLGYYPRTDLHSLFLTDPGYNSSRGNNYFDACTASCTRQSTDLNGGRGGSSDSAFPSDDNWRSSTTWRVWSGRQGEAARALLYMDLRYDGTPHATGSNPEPDLVLTNNTAFLTDTAPYVDSSNAQSVAYMGLLSVVLSWNATDAPDALEVQHTDAVQSAQGNRNPFVDYPQWADCIHSGNCTAVAPMRPTALVATRTATPVDLDWADRPESDLDGYNVYRATAAGGPYTKLNGPLVGGSAYTDSTALEAVGYYYVVTAVDTDNNESPVSAEASVPSALTPIVFATQGFETGTGYTITGSTGAFATGTDYYDRFSDATAPAGLTVATAGKEGTFFIAGEDTNGTAPLPSDGIHTLTLDPITVTNRQSLEVRLLVGAANVANYDTAGLSNGDYLRVFAKLDAGAPVLLGQFTKVGTSGSNGKLGQDTDLDGLGDVEIPNYAALNDYTFPIAGTGNSLVVSVVTRFEAGNEEIVFDNVRVAGVTVSHVDGWMLMLE